MNATHPPYKLPSRRPREKCPREAVPWDAPKTAQRASSGDATEIPSGSAFLKNRVPFQSAFWECRVPFCECRVPFGSAECLLGVQSALWECRVPFGSAEWPLGVPFDSSHWECRVGVQPTRWRRVWAISSAARPPMRSWRLLGRKPWWRYTSTAPMASAPSTNCRTCTPHTA